jgi:CHASE3 domain sensor protein
MSTGVIVLIVLGVVVLLVLAVVFLTQLPEIRRYLKAKSM